MAQDIRDMFGKDEDESRKSHQLKSGHQKRFEAKLDAALPQKKKKNSFIYLKIAAVLVVAFGVAMFFFRPGITMEENRMVETPVEEAPQEDFQDSAGQFQLSDVSPQYREIENYYMASLNLELANLNITDDNKALIDAFMAKLAELDKEYKRLNADLKESGPNEQTVEAMVANLQLRLDLLFKLKNKIKEIKESKNDNYEDLQA
ncbi:hypothetical protein RM549_06940 [Salegentibacter sp. F188]|uniref:Uncharacterized protein n=1 Tax=Autumnicola patrickiae TaxID=3075591 RepID=A0ABU3E0I7_9FLAO|nr:hypothetical protein [Salegentibacter sp. F188]MDT0689513.1 hypothetical protein [Salegentibacter sp. F188]